MLHRRNLLGRNLLGLCGTVLLPAACSSPNPTLYTLATVTGPVRHGAPRIVELRAIALPRYLERSQIVRSSENYRLEVLGNEWWGEPLDAMLSRVLVQELTQRLPDSTVFAENGAVSATPDATVAINLQRLDQDRTGALVLAAQIAVRRRSDLARSVTFPMTPPSGDTIGLVTAMSSAVGKLADTVAAMLVG